MPEEGVTLTGDVRRGSPPSRRGRVPVPPRLRSGAPLLVLAVIITALAWPIPDRRPIVGPDPSWEIALHVATWMGLRQGVDLVFSYGPLGFLEIPEPYLGGTSLLALLASAAVYFALVGVLLVETRRFVPLWAAAILVLVIARTLAYLPTFEAYEVLVFIVCVEALAGRIRLPPLTVATLIGVAAGVASLGKLNVGVFVVAMGAVTALTLDRTSWRNALAFAAAATVTFLGAWVVTGQELGDLVAFASGAIQITGGYSAAMSQDRDPEMQGMYVAFVAIATVFGWMAYRFSEGWPRGRRIGLMVVCLILGFAMWKTTFTRPNPPYAFATFVLGIAVLGASTRDRRKWLASLLAAGITFVVVVRVAPSSAVNIIGSARSLVAETVTAVVPSRAQAAENRNRASLRAQYGIDTVTLDHLTGQRVSIDASEAGVAFAYPELTWSPVPVFQSYVAYTPELDQLNADRLSSPDAPGRILRTFSFQRNLPTWLTRQRGRSLQPGESVPFVVDGRYQWFEAPTAQLQMFCRYAQLSASERWQVLGLSGGSCGQPEELGVVQAQEGETVNVPVETRPDRFVIVRVHGLEPSLIESLRTALFKADEWFVTISDTRYRLVAATAADGLLMAVPPSADGTGPFAFGPRIASLSIESDQGSGNRQLSYEFESVPLLRP